MWIAEKKGFTLVELLVAMALVSMVTLVVAMALKLAIEAWERGVEEGEDVQIMVAIPAILEKQLKSIVRTTSFGATKRNHNLPFYGWDHALSFFTSYAPQGSPWQGLLRVTYLFDEREETLFLFEQVITREEDLKEELNPLSEKWDNATEPISQVPGITVFRLTYTDRIDMDPDDMDQWKETWGPDSRTSLIGLGLHLQVGEDADEQSRKWYFQVGGEMRS